jgi:hypothetical protein
VANRKRALLQAIVKEHVAPGAEIFTDALKSYEGLEDDYLHQFVDHAVEYVKGHVHTNGTENFWCLLKRSLKGTYVSVAAYHLLRYVDEQAFRYNERNDERGDLGRFRRVVQGCAGKRLTYRKLTDKEHGGKTAHDHHTHNRA